MRFFPKRLLWIIFYVFIVFFIYTIQIKEAELNSSRGHHHHEYVYNKAKPQKTSRFVSLTAEKTIVEEEEGDECLPPQPLVVDGLPWANCQRKMSWMEYNWKTDKCYSRYGADGSTCSFYKYLSEVERECPPKSLQGHGETKSSTKGNLRDSFDGLWEMFGEEKEFAFMRKRTVVMETAWIKAAHNLFLTETLGGALNIHINLGLLELHMGEAANKGGPMGELVQWVDVISALYVMGHEITITKNVKEVMQLYKVENETSLCPPATKLPFDLIFTDILGMQFMIEKLSTGMMSAMKCKLRVLDSFGTEAIFNQETTAKKYGLTPSAYGNMQLDLKQFYTMFPHSPDNTFLGFVLENPDNVTQQAEISDISSQNRNIALAYGKQADYFKSHHRYLDIVREYFPEIHTTITKMTDDVPSYVINHGVVSYDKLLELYSQSKLFIGLGFPYEGPAPLEAIANGATFLNPSFDPPINSQNTDFFKHKPTLRKLRSQCPYAEEYIGWPHAVTLDIRQEDELRNALKAVKNNSPNIGHLPIEFTFKGMLERVNIIVHTQNFCVPKSFHNNVNQSNWWPPLSSLKIVPAKNNLTCIEACAKGDLMCDSSYFQAVNRKEAFPQKGYVCDKLVKMNPDDSEIDYPAYDDATRTCFLQTDRLKFSCAGRYTNLTRICPCRDYRVGQSALCINC